MHQPLGQEHEASTHSCWTWLGALRAELTGSDLGLFAHAVGMHVMVTGRLSMTLDWACVSLRASWIWQL